MGILHTHVKHFGPECIIYKELTAGFYKKGFGCLSSPCKESFPAFIVLLAEIAFMAHKFRVISQTN